MSESHKGCYRHIQQYFCTHFDRSILPNDHDDDDDGDSYDE